MKLTPWFPASVKPVRPGVYERDVDWMRSARPKYARWNGKYWLCFMWTKEGAALARNRSDLVGPWRGLAEPPKEKK